MSEQRTLPRAALGSLATVKTETGELECRIVNVSASGIAVRTAASETLGRFVHVSTDLGLGTPRIDIDAIVVRRELREDRIIWGLRFDELPRQIVSRLETYVRRKSLDELG